MMLSAGDSERMLISQEALRLAQQARQLTLQARELDHRIADVALDAGGACSREAERLCDQLDRAKRNRPPRGGRAR
jgi:hypothetical protein